MNKEPVLFHVLLERIALAMYILSPFAIYVHVALCFIMVFLATAVLAFANLFAYRVGEKNEKESIITPDIAPMMVFVGIMLALVSLVAWIF